MKKREHPGGGSVRRARSALLSALLTVSVAGLAGCGIEPDLFAAAENMIAVSAAEETVVSPGAEDIVFELNDDMQRATFVKKVDGDTAWFSVSGEPAVSTKTDPGYSVVSTEFKVRFLAVDTPETVKEGTDVQAWGPEASEYTTERLKSASVIYLEWDNASEVRDRYDRYLAWIWVDGSLLQAELVERGLASVTYIYGDYKYLDELYAIEAAAQTAGVGIWSE